MTYTTPWSQLPEREVLANNFRTAVTGQEMSINRIRWVHPTRLPEHTHPDAEQAMVLTRGRIRFQVEDEEMELSAGDVVIVPRGTRHGGSSIEGEAEFIEIFAPRRVENLLGFLGSSSMPDPVA
jgi:quercetin dioxygenase-like cupin family protein